MSRHTLSYNGIDLSTFGVYVSGENAWAKPAPEYEHVSVPGRSGDVLLYNGRYSNIDITYRMGIVSDFNTNYNALISHLLSSPGYHKLIDSAHPDGYRMAVITAKVLPDMTRMNRKGQFDVTFHCKPQFYLDEGEEDIYMIKAGSAYGDDVENTIVNPTAFPVWPLIKISIPSSSGTVYLNVQKKSGANSWSAVGQAKFVVDGTNMELYIDTETGNVTDASGSNMNTMLKISESQFVQIPGGGRITSVVPNKTIPTNANVKIVPRWWRL